MKTKSKAVKAIKKAQVRDRSHLTTLNLPVEMWDQIKVQAERESKALGMRVSGRALLFKYVREGLDRAKKKLDSLSQEA